MPARLVAHDLRRGVVGVVHADMDGTALTVLLRQRVEAGADPLGLVAGGDDHRHAGLCHGLQLEHFAAKPHGAAPMTSIR